MSCTFRAAPIKNPGAWYVRKCTTGARTKLKDQKWEFGVAQRRAGFKFFDIRPVSFSAIPDTATVYEIRVNHKSMSATTAASLRRLEIVEATT